MFKKEIIVDCISNTIMDNGKINESKELSAICKRAYELENKIYELDPRKFGLAEFTKAFVGANKLDSHPCNKPLPYNPEDINVFNNSILIFKDVKKNKDIGYFTALCFFKKNGNNIESIHIRFMAGIDENYRGQGFYYVPLFRQVFAALQEFSERYSDQNPVVNITQFAMVSAGTPGAIINFASILSHFLPEVAEFKYGDEEAIKLARVFGFGEELLDLKTGKAYLNMKIKIPTFYQNKNNKGANSYGSLNLNPGDGIVGRQELGTLNDLLKLSKVIKSSLTTFADVKSAKAKL